MGFSASRNKITKITAWAAGIFLLALLLLGWRKNEMMWGIIATIVLLLALSFFVFVLLKPLRYSFVRGSLVVKGPLRKHHIPLGYIELASEMNNGELLRTFGGTRARMFLRPSGKLLHSPQGTFRSYATRLDKGVVLHLQNGEKLILTPDEPARFMAALQMVKGKQPASLL